jgi:hypothetical protein
MKNSTIMNTACHNKSLLYQNHGTLLPNGKKIRLTASYPLFQLTFCVLHPGLKNHST